MPILQANPFLQMQNDLVLGNVFNTANQSFINMQQSLASAANNRLATQLSQENAFLKEQRNSIARADALELETRRRFEGDREYARLTGRDFMNDLKWRDEQDSIMERAERPYKELTAYQKKQLELDSRTEAEKSELAGLQQKVYDGTATKEDIARINSLGRTVAPPKADTQAEEKSLREKQDADLLSKCQAGNTEACNMLRARGYSESALSSGSKEEVKPTAALSKSKARLEQYVEGLPNVDVDDKSNFYRWVEQGKSVKEIEKEFYDGVTKDSKGREIKEKMPEDLIDLINEYQTQMRTTGSFSATQPSFSARNFLDR